MATPTAPQLNNGPLKTARALWLAAALLGCEEPEPDLLLSSGLDGGAFPMELGAGERAFAPLAEDQVLPYVTGPQDGYHVFVAFRMSDLEPKRVLVTVKTTIEDSEEDLQLSLRDRVNFERDEAAESYVYAGFPAVIADASEHTGERTRIDVVLEDPVGRHASASQTIVIGE